MPDLTTSLNEKRAEKQDDNRLWSAKDCATAFLREIVDGTINPDQVLILYREPGVGDSFKMNSFQCNVSRADQLALLKLSEHFLMQDWLYD